MADLKELRDQRGKAIEDARSLLDRAEKEKRQLNDDEQSQWDKHMDEADNLKKNIEREERQLEAEREAAAIAARKDDGEGGDEGRDQGKGEKRDNPRGAEEYRAAYDKFMRHGKDSLSGDDIRALSAGTDTEGGYLTMPQQMVNDMIKFVDDAVFIRRLATVHQVPSAEGLGVPSLDTDPADADWTTELQTGSLDSSMAFGKRELRPHPMAKRIKISRELLRRVPSAEALVRQRLGYKFGLTEEKAYLSGSGNQRPLGLFTASNDGISTSRDVSTGNTSTAITFDGLLEAKYSLKTPYRMSNSISWLFHRDAVKMLAKIKDGDGNYIWKQSVREGEPDRLLDLPFNESEHAPNTFTTGLYVGLLGDFSFYWIADAMDMELQRLVELYAESNQVGLIGRKAGDGMPVLEEAFSRVKLA